MIANRRFAMKKIAIFLACTMMLAGCTELLDDSTEATTYTNQDLEIPDNKIQQKIKELIS